MQQGKQECLQGFHFTIVVPFLTFFDHVPWTLLNMENRIRMQSKSTGFFLSFSEGFPELSIFSIQKMVNMSDSGVCGWGAEGRAFCSKEEILKILQFLQVKTHTCNCILKYKDSQRKVHGTSVT